MEWHIDASAPVYAQLIAQIKLGIVSGEYAAGSRLPSVRDMALEAGVNPNTMQRALSELERSGLVYAQRTAGRFVTEDLALIEDAKRSLAEQNIRRFLDAMSRLGYMREEITALLRSRVEEENGNADL
jgi:GntR family transcriptional regulator